MWSEFPWIGSLWSEFPWTIFKHRGGRREATCLQGSWDGPPCRSVLSRRRTRAPPPLSRTRSAVLGRDVTCSYIQLQVCGAGKIREVGCGVRRRGSRGAAATRRAPRGAPSDRSGTSAFKGGRRSDAICDAAGTTHAGFVNAQCTLIFTHTHGSDSCGSMGSCTLLGPA